MVLAFLRDLSFGAGPDLTVLCQDEGQSGLSPHLLVQAVSHSLDGRGHLWSTVGAGCADVQKQCS